jgi:hypothetical protein
MALSPLTEGGRPDPYLSISPDPDTRNAKGRMCLLLPSQDFDG